MNRSTSPHFASALRTLRKAKGLSQEQFDSISSRTYISSLERGLKDPTLGKIDQLSQVLGAHPLALLALAYCSKGTVGEVDRLLAQVRRELVDTGCVRTE